MTDLVCEHIGFGELTGRSEPAFEFVVETKVDVDLLVLRAIKRTGCGLCHPACRSNRIAEQDQLGVMVCNSVACRQNPRPCCLSVVQHESDKIHEWLFGFVSLPVSLACRPALLPHAPRTAAVTQECTEVAM